MGDRQERHHAEMTELVRSHLGPDEELHGVVSVNDQGIFTARSYVVGVTPDRLVFVPTTQRGKPKGTPFSLRAADVAKVQGLPASAGGGGLADPGDAVKRFVAQESATTIKLATTDGRKMKLMLIDGGGALGKYLASQSQLTGADALFSWLDLASPR